MKVVKGMMNKTNHKIRGNWFIIKGQAIVEFAIALPILMAVIVGIFEVGRMVLIYSSVANASRNAARYASAVGLTESGGNLYQKHLFCDGIKSVAIQSAYLIRLDTSNVTIAYDDGALPSPSSLGSCTATGGEQTGVAIVTGDRVTVTVTATYAPMVKLIPFGTRNFTASSSRTILGIIDL